MTPSQLKTWFEYHAPEDHQTQRLIKVRTAMAAAAQVFLEQSDCCADQTHALRMHREAMQAMFACIVAPMPR